MAQCVVPRIRYVSSPCFCPCLYLVTPKNTQFLSINQGKKFFRATPQKIPQFLSINQGKKFFRASLVAQCVVTRLRFVSSAVFPFLPWFILSHSKKFPIPKYKPGQKIFSSDTSGAMCGHPHMLRVVRLLFSLFALVYTWKTPKKPGQRTIVAITPKSTQFLSINQDKRTLSPSLQKIPNS